MRIERRDGARLDGERKKGAEIMDKNDIKKMHDSLDRDHLIICIILIFSFIGTCSRNDRNDININEMNKKLTHIESMLQERNGDK
jgi:hypothetical protein